MKNKSGGALLALAGIALIAAAGSKISGGGNESGHFNPYNKDTQPREWAAHEACYSTYYTDYAAYKACYYSQPGIATIAIPPADAETTIQLYAGWNNQVKYNGLTMTLPEAFTSNVWVYVQRVWWLDKSTGKSYVFDNVNQGANDLTFLVKGESYDILMYDNATWVQRII